MAGAINGVLSLFSLLSRAEGTEGLSVEKLETVNSEGDGKKTG